MIMRLPFPVHRPIEAVIAAVLSVDAVAAFWFYAGFPARVPIHWNIAGQADGWSGPAFAAFFFPALIIGLYLLLLFMPMIDPHRDRYREFARPYQLLRLGLVVALSALYFAASFAGLGYPVPIGRVVPVGIGLLFILIGLVLPRVKLNWFVGIRTPWTMSNEEVWDKTHRLGGRLFVAGGLVAVLAAFLPPMAAFVTMLTAIAAVAAVTVVYSWVVWRKAAKLKS